MIKMFKTTYNFIDAIMKWFVLVLIISFIIEIKKDFILAGITFLVFGAYWILYPLIYDLFNSGSSD